MQDSIGGIVLAFGFFLCVLIFITGSIDAAVSILAQMVGLALKMVGLG